jgi:hypothetical protein
MRGDVLRKTSLNSGEGWDRKLSPQGEPRQRESQVTPPHTDESTIEDVARLEHRRLLDTSESNIVRTWGWFREEFFEARTFAAMLEAATLAQTSRE